MKNLLLAATAAFGIGVGSASGVLGFPVNGNIVFNAADMLHGTVQVQGCGKMRVRIKGPGMGDGRVRYRWVDAPCRTLRVYPGGTVTRPRPWIYRAQ